MTRFGVTSQVYRRKTGQLIGKVQYEIIDNEKNDFFRKARNINNVKGLYQKIWNSNPHSSEIVRVKEVKILD